MDDDGVDDFWSGKDEAPVEVEVFVSAATTPACFLAFDGDAAVCDFHLLCKLLRAPTEMFLCLHSQVLFERFFCVRESVRVYENFMPVVVRSIGCKLQCAALSNVG